MRFGVAQAERYQDGLFDMFRMLAANPRMARVRSEFEPPVRLHPYQKHMIVYIESDARNIIVRVLYGRQDWGRILSPA